ncbi:hypothetical protein J1614_011713 [Plenodomus biglobosus]|nr:hypothetical protein J1614_011713 [Plenodomus biglobosus]
MHFRNFYELLDALDECYGQTTYEKISGAQPKVQDRSLRQTNQSFAEWRGTFVPLIKKLNFPKSAMVGYARQFMRPSLAKDASIGFDDNQPGALAKFLEAARKANLTYTQNNTSCPDTKRSAPANKASRQSTNNGNPNAERRKDTGRYGHRQVQAAASRRTNEQKDIMTKAQLSAVNLNAIDADFVDDEDTPSKTEDEQLDEIGNSTTPDQDDEEHFQ